MNEKLLSISDPWLKYSIKFNSKASEKELADLKKEALKDVRIKAYLEDVSNFHGMLVTNHKNPELPMHKLLFLLDNGFGTEVPQIEKAIKHIMSHKDKNGVYQSMTNIPKHYGGKGEDTFGWCLCDAPLLLLALVKAKVDHKQHIEQGVKHLSTKFKEDGFPCTVSEEHGSFRGPGRKDESCPNATFCMLRLYSEIDEYRKSDQARKSVNYILSLWENSLEKHPFMFYMGTDFRKLKAPAMWYDIVSVADVISRFDFAKKDKRFLEMISIIKQKQDADGLFIPESVYQKCKDWDFGQKKKVSPYLSFFIIRIFERLGD